MAEMVKATLNHEHEIWLPKHRADRPEWYTQEGWEKERLRYLKNEITFRSAFGPYVVYYVGAEEGEMAALCQMWGAQTVLFEPNPLVWPNIKAIWDANELATPLVNFCGFAAATTDLAPGYGRDERAWFGKDWPPSAYGVVIHDHGFKELHSQCDEFPRITIDDVQFFGAPPPTLITFDVEGAEWEVMKGAEQTLREHRPVLMASIHPEFMALHYDQHSNDFRRWLRDEMNYEETFIDYQHELHMLYTPR